MIDLDANATTRPTEAVVDATCRAMRELWANPSSLHRPGQRARAAVELARRQIAGLIAARPQEIVFTSGASEALRTAIEGVLDARPPDGRPPAVVASPIEHAAVRETLRRLAALGRLELRPLKVTSEGLLDPGALPPLLDDRVALVAVHAVNNETGAIQDVPALADAAHARAVPLLVDATQAAGRLPLDVREPQAGDLVAFSPHKFHGPKGVGVLWARRAVPINWPAPGAQELGRRAGTENVPAIVGAGVAATEAHRFLADPAPRRRLAAMRDRIEHELLQAIPGAAANGPSDPARRAWTTANIRLPGVAAEALLLALSERGVAASAGAACSSGAVEPSAVLLAMGLGETAASESIRLSISRLTTDAEITRAIGIIADAAASARQHD